MSTSNTLTKNDLKKVLEKLSISTGGEGALNDMTAQEIEEFLSEIEVDGPNVVDYVVDRGTETASGIEWTYRKWNSGTAECWGKWSGNLTHYITVGSLYGYNTGALYYPTDLFVEEPNAHFSGRIGGGFCLTGTLYGAAKDYISCYALSTASNTVACVFYIYSIGRWK